MNNMVALLLAFVMCLSLCACGGNDTPETTDPLTMATLAPTEEMVIPPTVQEPTAQTTQPTEEKADTLYMPYIGKWVCSDGYYVIVNEDGTLIYNDTEYAPDYFEMGDGVAVYLEDAEYTYYAGMDRNGEVYVTAKGCVFVWGLTERFGEGVMVGDHDGRLFIFQAE